ncbi:MAG: hypothetical protein ABW277_10550 [Longimicrobiaceae bacterium]
MADFLKRLQSFVNGVLGVRTERTVHRTFPDPVLGELRFVGSQARPGGPIHGRWEVTPPGFTHRVRVAFPSGAEPPAPEDLAELGRILGDLDGLFERFRSAAAAEYAGMVGEPLPADWRTALRLDDIELPDPEDAEAWWSVSYWCEAALHWLVVTFDGDTVVDVGMEG